MNDMIDRLRRRAENDAEELGYHGSPTRAEDAFLWLVADHIAKLEAMVEAARKHLGMEICVCGPHWTERDLHSPDCRWAWAQEILFELNAYDAAKEADDE